MDFGVWATAAPSGGVEWSIGSSPLGNDLGSGTASLFGDTLLCLNGASYGAFQCSDTSGNNVYNISFLLPGGLALDPGTYWLSLTTSSTYAPFAWDENDNPSSSAWLYCVDTAQDSSCDVTGSSMAGTNFGLSGTNSQAFTMDGTVVPEPNLALVCFASLAGIIAFRRRIVR